MNLKDSIKFRSSVLKELNLLEKNTNEYLDNLIETCKEPLILSRLILQDINLNLKTTLLKLIVKKVLNTNLKDYNCTKVQLRPKLVELSISKDYFTYPGNTESRLTNTWEITIPISEVLLKWLTT